ncbi:UNVERIFIED_CONTAM: hypothetical protein Sindi_0918000, partial [Sesamum indicum]
GAPSGGSGSLKKLKSLNMWENWTLNGRAPLRWSKYGGRVFTYSKTLKDAISSDHGTYEPEKILCVTQPEKGCVNSAIIGAWKRPNNGTKFSCCISISLEKAR